MLEPSLHSLTPKFPVHEVLEEVASSLATHHVVLEAPPGAGKSTVLPRWLMEQFKGWNGRIILVQPRRVAAVNVAQFIAAQLGEEPGQRVGFHIRNHRCISNNTQLVVVTEGIFTRMIQHDPELTGIGLVIFDEFHERNLHSDLGLALCLDLLPLRDDLRLMIMSATLPGQLINDWLQSHAIATKFIRSAGRQFPIDVHYRPPKALHDWQAHLPQVIEEALALANQGVLVFLPGQREIRQLLNHFSSAANGITVMPLYGGLSIEAQQQVLQPLAKGLKLVLATNVAETSLTIPDIDVVVDSGRERQASYDPRYGFTKLQTRMIAKASAIQRAGRAGRVAAGHCFRLWPQTTTDRLEAYGIPAIEREDLANLLLELKVWGTTPEQLAWFTVPSASLLAAAEQQLEQLQAVSNGAVTAVGTRLAEASTDLRYAAMLEYARQQSLGLQTLAAWLVANFEEREGELTGDLEAVLAQCYRGNLPLPRTKRRFQYWLKYFGISAINSLETAGLAELLLQGFPDRVAQHQGKRLQLATGLAVQADMQLSQAAWLVAVDLSLSEDQSSAKLWSYAVIEKNLLASTKHPLATTKHFARWRGEQGGLERLEQQRWGSLVLAEKQALGVVTRAERGLAMARWLQTKGWSVTAWGSEEEALCARIQQLMLLREEPAANWQPAQLLANIETWALPWLESFERRADLKRWQPKEALLTVLGYESQQQLAQWLPTHWQAPSERRHKIHYELTEMPRVALKLQEVFGTPSSPTLANGQLVLAFELLSPAGRLLHRTADLASFWQNAWPEVRKQMRGRYSKHPWPEDPLSAEATHLTKRALAHKKQ